MKTKLIATGILYFALAGVGSAQGMASPAGSGAHYTRIEIKQMVREAHTPEQFSALASYYGVQQKHYLQQAAEEKEEWERRSQNVMVVAAKYPRPVDSARYLYEYYLTEATEAEGLATKYSQLATQGSAGTAR
jgi:hypothetical protein